MPRDISRRTDLNVGLGLTFNDHYRLQDGLIADRGQTVVHELGLSCTCRKASGFSEPIVGGSGVISCGRCENGILYRNPRQIMCLVSGISYQRRLIEEGLVAPGDCLISVSPNLKNPPSDFDRITFTWPEPINDGQVIVRGDGVRDNLDSEEDRLNYSGAEAIHVEDEDDKIYYQNSDFRFKGKKIIWMNGPGIRKRYTVKYTGYVSWIVFTPPFTRRDRDNSLGPRIMLRKSHIVDLRAPVDSSVIDSSVFRPTVSA